MSHAFRESATAPAIEPAWKPAAGVSPVGESHWVSLRWLAASRVAIAILLLAFVPLNEAGRFATEIAEPALFERTAVAYLLLAVFYLSMVGWRSLRFRAVLTVHAFTDLLALATLMHAAGGLRSGLVVLLISALAGAAVLSTRQLAALFAAVATLLVIGEAAWTVLRGAGSEAGSLMWAGLVGIGCFASAMIVNWLATRLHAQEEIARRRGEDLRRQLAVTSRVVDELDQGVLIIDRGGQLLTMNPAARNLLGAMGEAGAGVSSAGLAMNAVQQAYRRWRADASKSVSELDCGDARLSLRFLDTGEVGNDVVVMIDDRRRIEERAQQLKLASMGRLSASIAHEVRNPLAAIRHANSLLAERLHDATLTRLSHIVETNTIRIDRIVEDVLSIARRERAADEAIELPAFLKTVLPEFIAASGADPKRISVRIESPHAIRFDSNHLRQVLLNLLGNALRYASDAEGAILISWREREPHRLELRVADDGPGLPAEMLPHAFEPFFTTENRGTGLGLYLARELCHANSAAIRYEAGAPAQRYRSAFVIEPAFE